MNESTEMNTDQTSAAPPEQEAAPNVQTAEFQTFDGQQTTSDKERRIDLLLDISLPVSIELGRTRMMIKDILQLQRGSIVEFDKFTGDPVDILINGKKVAEGEVVVVEKQFGVRITNLVEAPERIKGLGK